MRQEYKERERFWRAFYQAKKTGRTSEVDDLPPPPLASPFMTGTQAPIVSQQQPATVIIPQTFINSLGYREEDASTGPAYNGPSFNGQPGSSSMPFTNNDLACSAGASSSPLAHRPQKYSPYPYPIARDGRWPISTVPAMGTAAGDSAVTPPHSESPVYVNSPSLTSSTEMTTYPTRFPGDEQKSALNSVLESAPYVFPNADRFQHQDGVPSRSLSPTLSTLSSNASNPLTSFQFNFHEANAGQDRPEFDYRRHSLPNCPEVTLHGGTADISLTPHCSDAVRYRVGRKDSCADRQPMHATSETGSQVETTGSDGMDPSRNLHHLRRDDSTNSLAHSRSSSPSSTQASCTVAVIKAHAFGSLRRTRTKTKRSAEGAHRVAMDVLEARGIGMGPSTGSKRPRLEDNDDLDAETP